MGYDCIISPVIWQEPVAQADVLLENCGADAFVATSGYALPILANSQFALSKPLYLTGEILASKAKELGFLHIYHGDASGRSLLDYMAKDADKSLHYVCLHSNHQAVNMAFELQQLGFGASSLEVYQTHPTKSLSEEAIIALQQGDVAAISLYSTMSAQSFMQLVEAANLQHKLKRIKAICLSQNIANVLPDGIFSEIIIDNF